MVKAPHTNHGLFRRYAKAEHELKLAANLENLGIQFVSPYTFEANGQEYQVQLLVKGFGAKNGMVIEKSWEAIVPISEWLIQNNYGYSCLNPDESFTLVAVRELLQDWGIYIA